MNNLEHYLDLGHAFFTELGWKPGKLKATVDPGTLPGCHLVKNGNLSGIYLGLNCNAINPIQRGGVILLPLNCIWEFFNLLTWKSQNCNLENPTIL